LSSPPTIPLLRTSFEPLWAKTRTIRDAVDRVLAGYPQDIRCAAVMVASELIENAIKYGEEVPQAMVIAFALELEQGRLRIETQNGCTDPRAIAGLQACMDELRQAEDKEALYLNRLRELLNNPADSGKLGLYRIAFEGEFTLACHVSSNVITIRAERDCPATA
jgi:hypothetical protein